MSLEAALAANTEALRELIEVLKAQAPIKNAPITAADVARERDLNGGTLAQAKARAQETANIKKSDTSPTAAAASAKPGAASASTPTKSSDAPTLAAWHEKTAPIFAELKDEEATLENVRKAILAINKEIGRDQADAVLARFGAQAVSSKADKKGLEPEQYGEFFKLCLEVLAGYVDATESVETA